MHTLFYVYVYVFKWLCIIVIFNSKMTVFANVNLFVFLFATNNSSMFSVCRVVLLSIRLYFRSFVLQDVQQRLVLLDCVF